MSDNALIADFLSKKPVTILPDAEVDDTQVIGYRRSRRRASLKSIKVTIKMPIGKAQAQS